MNYESFCGGIFETNCYLFKAPEGWILFDAPEGTCEWLRSLEVDLKLLLLTHGHIDHVQDVARIKRQFGCPIGNFFVILVSNSKSSLRSRIFSSKKHQTEFFSALISKFWKFQGIAREVFVSFRPRINCSSAAMYFLPEASGEAICRAEISTF